MARTIKILGMIGVIVIAWYVVLVYQNNRDSQPMDKKEIAQSYERGVTWLLNHREDILRDGNAALWWMVGESARVNGDPRMQKLFDEFVENFAHADPYSVWQAYFHPERFRNARFSESEFASLVEYQQYFLYALTCSEQLAAQPLIQAQHDPNFCWSGARIVRPACVTHQLMGYRMAKRNNCAIENLEAKINKLQRVISNQLTYDPRLVDVYIQRVLMLIDSGADNQVKPKWIKQIIAAQQTDGGWSDMQPLIFVGNGKSIGFNAAGITIGQPISNFHATAQGVLLMSLLQHHQ